MSNTIETDKTKTNKFLQKKEWHNQVHNEAKFGDSGGADMVEKKLIKDNGYNNQPNKEAEPGESDGAGMVEKKSSMDEGYKNQPQNEAEPGESDGAGMVEKKSSMDEGYNNQPHKEAEPGENDGAGMVKKKSFKDQGYNNLPHKEAEPLQIDGAGMVEKNSIKDKEKQNMMPEEEELEVGVIDELLQLVEEAANKKPKSVQEPFHWPTADLEYEVYDVIGKGGIATVNLAKCIKNDEVCAIKRISLPPRNRLYNVINEVQIMSQLRHPNLLGCYTSFVYNTELWIVLDYYHFGSLDDIMNREAESGFKKLFSEQLISSLMKDVLTGLEYMHDHGLVHADIKPGNILLRDDGSAVLSDFGSARYVSDIEDRLITTQVFRAPELRFPENLSTKADIWSLGMTAVNLSGEPILSMLRSTEDLLVLYREFAKSSHLFEWVVSSCLVLEPRRRLNASLNMQHSFFQKPMKKPNIVRILSKIPANDWLWKRQERPYNDNLLTRVMRELRARRKLRIAEPDSYTLGWLLDTPNYPSQDPNDYGNELEALKHHE